MKKLLFILLLIPVALFGQLQLPYSVKVVNPLPLDYYYYNTSGIPYTSTTQANTQIISAIRYQGMTVNIAGVEYWYALGIADVNLIAKGGGGGSYWGLSGASTITADVTIDGAHSVQFGTIDPLTDFGIITTTGGVDLNALSMSLNSVELLMQDNIGSGNQKRFSMAPSGTTYADDNSKPIFYDGLYTDASANAILPRGVIAGLLRNLSIPAPTSGDDGKVLTYNHATTSWVYSTGGGGGGSGTVTNVTGTSPISITSTPTTTPNVTISDAVADGSTKGAASFTTNDFNSSSGNISIDYTNGQASTNSVKGFLTSADHTTFAAKQDALVSGTNIKTVNGNDLTGTGDVIIAASTSGVASVGQVGKSKFDVSGYAIFRMRTNTGSPGGGNYYLTYEILTPSDAHDSHFIYSSSPDPSTGEVRVHFPSLKTIYRGGVDPDDVLTGFGFKIGLGVDPSVMHGYFNYQSSTSSLVKISDVTSTPTQIAILNPPTYIAVDGSGVFRLTGGAQWAFQTGAINISAGLKTGVAIYNNEDNATNNDISKRFSLRDVLGNKITSFDSGSDGDFMWVSLPSTTQVMDARTYNPGFWPVDIGFEARIVNFFSSVAGEAWLISSPTTSTSTISEWQHYPSATDFQLYRSLQSAASVDLTTGAITFGTETMVYTGTGYSYTDTGLSAGTIYYYHLKATVGGVPDTDITFFDVKTNP